MCSTPSIYTQPNSTLDIMDYIVDYIVDYIRDYTPAACATTGQGVNNKLYLTKGGKKQSFRRLNI